MLLRGVAKTRTFVARVELDLIG